MPLCTSSLHQLSSNCQFPLITLYSKYYYLRCKTTDRFWDDDFVLSFCFMMNHVQHNCDIKYFPCNFYRGNLSAPQVSAVLPLPSKIVTVVCQDSHFVALLLEVNKKTTTIFDGLCQPLSKWLDAACYLL
jgi:hypothetical protein